MYKYRLISKRVQWKELSRFGLNYKKVENNEILGLQVRIKTYLYMKNMQGI